MTGLTDSTFHAYQLVMWAKSIALGAYLRITGPLPCLHHDNDNLPLF